MSSPARLTILNEALSKPHRRRRSYILTMKPHFHWVAAIGTDDMIHPRGRRALTSKNAAGQSNLATGYSVRRVTWHWYSTKRDEIIILVPPLPRFVPPRPSARGFAHHHIKRLPEGAHSLRSHPPLPISMDHEGDSRAPYRLRRKAARQSYGAPPARSGHGPQNLTDRSTCALPPQIIYDHRFPDNSRA